MAGKADLVNSGPGGGDTTTAEWLDEAAYASLDAAVAAGADPQRGGGWVADG